MLGELGYVVGPEDELAAESGSLEKLDEIARSRIPKKLFAEPRCRVQAEISSQMSIFKRLAFKMYWKESPGMPRTCPATTS